MPGSGSGLLGPLGFKLGTVRVRYGTGSEEEAKEAGACRRRGANIGACSVRVMLSYLVGTRGDADGTFWLLFILFYFYFYF